MFHEWVSSEAARFWRVSAEGCSTSSFSSRDFPLIDTLWVRWRQGFRIYIEIACAVSGVKGDTC
jgi:hypothetical protein